jgi:uncharacterized protein YndB with AHSA1/START domain
MTTRVGHEVDASDPQDGIPAVERQLELAASPERVWRALTDAHELATWFADAADFSPRPGYLGWMEWREHGRFAVRVEASDPPRSLAWRWAREPDRALDEGVSTLVEWWLEERPGGGTHLRLRESGFVREDDRRTNVWGWLEGFAALARRLAQEPWQGGVSRTWALRSSRDRVWRAFADPAELAAWWGGTGVTEVRPGYEGWWVWPTEGRFAMRIEAVEPPAYLAWTWAPEPDVPLERAEQVLRTEWVLVARDDGGTDLHLFESGFRGPRDHELNEQGWDGDVLPGLRRHLGEDPAS